MPPNPLPPIVAYARVSTREQAETFNALEQQIERLRGTDAEEILVDVDSGRDDDRPEFLRMMQAVRDGTVQKVIVTRLDRLTRSLPTLRKALSEFQKAGAILVALDENIDPDTSMGKFQINMLGALAEMESDRLSERIRHGKKHFRQQKRTAHAGFGYRVVDFKLEPDRTPFLCTVSDKQEWSKYQMARSLVQTYLRLRSANETCRWFIDTYGYQEFWGSALIAWLKRATNRGHLTYYPKSENPEIHYNTHEPLITEDEYQEISEILAFNKQVGGYGARRGTYSLTGLVRCGVCGFACVVCNSGHSKAAKGRIKAFVCSKSRFGEAVCPSKNQIQLKNLEAAVIDVLIQRADAIATFADSGDSPESAQLTELRGQLSDLERIAYNPIIEEAKGKLRLEIESLAIKQKSSNSANQATRELLATVGGDREFWATLPSDQKNRFFRALVAQVIMAHGQILRIDLKI